MLQVNYRFSQRALSAKSSDVRDLLQYAQNPEVISLAGGLPAAEFFDVKGISAAAAQVFHQTSTAALQYGMTEGQPRLKAALQNHLARKGIVASDDTLVVTSGSQQGLDLIARAFINSGDTIVVESPTYLAALQAFNLCAPKYFSINIDDDGGCVQELQALERLPIEQKPKLIYVVTNFANPSGVSISLERRKWLARWAARNEVFVLEDDPYGDLYDGLAPPTPLAAIAQSIPGASDWCGYASSLSKCLAPGLRIGWMVLPAPLAKIIVRLKQAMDLHTSTLSQEIAATYLESGAMDDRLAVIRAAYKQRRQTLTEALHTAFGSRLNISPSSGGMFLWGRFTDDTQTRPLLARAIAQKVIFVPGDVFYASAPDHSSLRLNFTSASPERLIEGVRRLALAVD
jgi:2-aminoadipate transaminase